MQNMIIRKFALLLVLSMLVLSCKQKQADANMLVEKEVQGSKIVKSSKSDVDIHYSVVGDGDHAVVFVHGWSCDQTYWEKQVPYFKDEYKVITLDLGGHGESGTNRSSWTMDSFASDVVDVLNDIEFTYLSIVGHSMGSVVVLNTIPQLDGKLKNVFFVDYFKSKPQASLTKEQIEKMTANFKTDFVNTTKGFVQRMFSKNSDTVLVNRITTKMSNANPVIALEAMNSMMLFDVEAGFQKIQEKKLEVNLINSDQRPVDTAYFNSLGFRSNIIENTGHFLMLELDEVFNELLEKALK